MRSFSILLLIGYIDFIFAHISITNYLDEKLRQTKIEIAKLHIQEEPIVERKVYNVKWNRLWKEDLNKELPFITDAFNKIFLVEANRFITFSFDTSNNISSREIIPISNNGSIKFIRSIIWKNVLYLLICYKTSFCSIYTQNNLQLRLRQTIQYEGYPMDANFFVRDNRLYLVVADNFGQFPVRSFIYHWKETYMDVIKDIITTAAVSVTTFKYKQSTIIIFAQNNENIPDIGSIVYEFTETSLDKIQFLKTSNPISVHHYRHAGFNFILLINQYEPSNLLWWDGYELLNWQQIPEIEIPDLIHIVNINDNNFFFVVYNNILKLYKFENASDCILINTMKLPSGMFLIDIRTRIDKSVVNMLLIIMNSDQIYNIESWELKIEEIFPEHSIKKSDTLSKNLIELVEMLQQRKPFLEKATALWSLLFSAHEDLTISKLLILQNLILDSGTVKNIKVFIDENIIIPRELEQYMENLIHEIDNVLMWNNINRDIIIDGDAFIEELQIDNVIVDFFNDVDIYSNDITDSTKMQKFSISPQKQDMIINDLKVESICGIPFRYWSLTSDVLKLEINLTSDKIEFSNDTIYLNSNISLMNLNVKMLNGTNINELFDELFIINHNQKIKGNIIYNNMLKIQNLTIQMLNEKSWNKYMNTITNQTFDNFMAKKFRVENLIADSINDIPVSKAARISIENIIKGDAKIAKLHVTKKFIIDSKFKISDIPYQIYSNVSIQENIKFDNLIVEGAIVTKKLNNFVFDELYSNLINMSISKITNLKIDGNISWDTFSINSTSLTFLFKNAVTKTTNQTIQSNIIFQKNISASTVKTQSKEIDKIHNIIADAVIDDEKNIEVIGQKIFKENLNIDTISVINDIDIPMINNVNILEFNNSVVRKDREAIITGIITFLDDVVIDQILVNDNVHNILLKDVVLATDVLPTHIFFKNLVILKNVRLKNFDKVDFDEFLKNRITIDKENEIFFDVHFNDIIEITENANASTINNIYISDLVLNESKETQIICDSKIFEENFIVNGNIYTSFINGMNISLEYYSGVQNDEDVKIIGDLIFESKIKVPENVSVFNLINEINLYTILYNLQEETHQIYRMFVLNEIKMKESIVQSSLISKTLTNIFSYLEIEQNLRIQIPNIKKIDVAYYEQITKLNMFGEETGHFCGLSNNCSCPIEYIAELTKKSCQIRKINNNKIIRNYQYFHNTYGINIESNAISYSRECTLNNTENEFITISWIKPNIIDTGDILTNVKEMSLKIRGFIKDAKFFTYDNATFLVLAVYYDTIHATHQTNSLIYKIDFKNNTLFLYQNISTDGAWTVEIFKRNHHDVYLLFGCFGNSEKSSLYKLDAYTSKFIIIRTFEGKTRNVKSLIQEQDCFVFLDDFETNAINIFYYDSEFDNFYSYQTLFYNSQVYGIECFYMNEFGQTNSFIIVITENDQFYIYEYMHAQKFQLKIHHRTDDLQMMVPFYHLENYYIFMGTSTNSTILRIIKQGP
ncbi:hypothetical protein HZU73_07383 [Apis mellifera caucasica]|nr:hypothetical protein HZU73_07383 [Apis mellifera caucasica]KAG9437742.1 hypothetical protein HZU67_00752 [Apis mellifera carnica]